MSHSLQLDPLELHRGFNDLAQEIDWDFGRPENLCVLITENNLGCLALAGAPNVVRDDVPTPIESVLMITDYRTGLPRIQVPSTIAEVRIGGGDYSFQNENLAKGIGILGANTPEAHARKNHLGPIAAVRAIGLPNQNFEDIFVGDGDDSLGSRATRYWQHGTRYMLARADDAAARLFLRGERGRKIGTDEAVFEKSQLYGSAVCALLPMSPIYYLYQQNRELVRPDVRPGHILANGNVRPPQSLARLGTCVVPYPQG